MLEAAISFVINSPFQVSYYQGMNNTSPLLAPARFDGMQDCAGIMPDFELWTLTEDIEGHPAGSTVSRQTLEAKGYVVPVVSIAA